MSSSLGKIRNLMPIRAKFSEWTTTQMIMGAWRRESGSNISSLRTNYVGPQFSPGRISRLKMGYIFHDRQMEK